VCLKRELGLPELPETRQAIQELEDQVHSLKLEMLHSSHPEQPMLPGMEDLPVEIPCVPTHIIHTTRVPVLMHA
jgi:hypothetical protein